MKIVIVGGSIAGLTVANLLHRQGIEVAVLERSEHSLSGRGAGIVIPQAIVDSCILAELFDEDIPSIPMRGRSFITKDNRSILEQSLSAQALNWADIYQNLRKRLPSSCYHQGEQVKTIIQTPDNYHVKTSKGSIFPFDYLIAADGFDSEVRKKVSLTESSPKYAGYVAWRGTILLSQLMEKAIFDHHIPYFVFPKGHILLYSIPAVDYRVTRNVLLNWVMYEELEHSKINCASSLAPGTLSPLLLQHLRTLANNVLPPHIAGIICQTESPFLQAIFDTPVYSFLHHKFCFIGDAAAVLRPHSTSGVLKALGDGLNLAKVFAVKESPIATALMAWGREQMVTLEQQVQLSKRMGSALVTHTPPWDKMSPEEMTKWWSDVMSQQTWYATSSPQSVHPATTYKVEEKKQYDQGYNMSINLKQKFSLFNEYWSPKIVGELNGQYIKLAKFKGEFIWHQHANEDEMFWVVKGEIKIELRDKTVYIKEGEFYIIPKGVEHKPSARQEAHIVLIEPKSIEQTGGIESQLLVDKQEWI